MLPDDNSHSDSLDDTNDFVSKTELKRLAHQATDIGKLLVSLDKATLNKLDLPQNVLDNVITAQSITSNIARKRQIQFLGKQIRNSDMQSIQQQLERLDQQHREDTQQFHALEQWRDRFLQQGDEAINDFLNTYPHADRQKLRQLVRQAHRETEKNAAPAAARKLFKYIKTVVTVR